MAVHWKAHRDHGCEDKVNRTVYIRGEFAPLVGWMATPDSYFSVPAYVLIKGKRETGYVSTEDGLFHPHNDCSHLFGIKNSYDRTTFIRMGHLCAWNRRKYTRGDEDVIRVLDWADVDGKGLQITVRHVASGWFQVATWVPGYRQERRNVPKAEMYRVFRLWRREAFSRTADVRERIARNSKAED